LRDRHEQAAATAAGAFAGIALTALVTLLCAWIVRVNAVTAGFAYLMVVLGIAARGRLAAAIVTSLAAALSFNYFFFHPVRTFSIADPQNWVAVLAFCVTALVASHLSSRARREAAEARQHQYETARLYAFSKAILQMDTCKPAGPQVVRRIVETFSCRSAVLYLAASGECHRHGAEDVAAGESRLEQVTRAGSMLPERAGEAVIVPITLDGRPIGSLGLAGLAYSDGALLALGNLVAITLERERAAEATGRAEAARQSQQFKSTLLDAIAHELKTPLTSIKAAATAVLSDLPSPAGPAGELVSIIDEEADRLTDLVDDAVHMAQIEADRMHIARSRVGLAAFLGEVISPFRARGSGRLIQLVAPDDLPDVSIDPKLMGLALRQLIDNAVKYSSACAPIRIRAMARDGAVEIRVLDGGPGIRAIDREHIFEKHYRPRASSGENPGTGLGLFIAREIVRAHGGDLRLAEGGGAGAEFRVVLAVEGMTEPARAAS